MNHAVEDRSEHVTYEENGSSHECFNTKMPVH